MLMYLIGYVGNNPRILGFGKFIRDMEGRLGPDKDSAGKQEDAKESGFVRVHFTPVPPKGL